MFLRIAATVIGLDGVETPERRPPARGAPLRARRRLRRQVSTRDHDEVVAEGLAAKERFAEHFYLPRPRAAAASCWQKRVERGSLGEDELPADLITTMLHHHGDELRPGPGAARVQSSTSPAPPRRPPTPSTTPPWSCCCWLEDHPDEAETGWTTRPSCAALATRRCACTRTSPRSHGVRPPGPDAGERPKGASRPARRWRSTSSRRTATARCRRRRRAISTRVARCRRRPGPTGSPSGPAGTSASGCRW